VGKEMLKFGSIFGSLPDFPSLSPLSQEREKSSRPVFIMCGEACTYGFIYNLQLLQTNQKLSLKSIYFCWSLW